MRWRVNAKDLTLVGVPEKGEAGGYWLDFRRMLTSAQVLDWVAQLSGKLWMSPRDLGLLVRGLDVVLHFQEMYCGGEVDHEVSEARIRKLLQPVHGRFLDDVCKERGYSV